MDSKQSAEQAKPISDEQIDEFEFDQIDFDQLELNEISQCQDDRDNKSTPDDLDFQLNSQQQVQKTEWQKPFPWDTVVDARNKSVFGNKTFRENQREIINATKSGKNVIALIPTGGGKSLTFQLPATIGRGVTVVIMPLISLIQDNLNYVQNVGISACSLSNATNSKMEDRTMYEKYNGIRQLQYKIVYTTPEKLVASPPLNEAIDYLYQNGQLDRFVIDEVHCVSHWGQDFRKDYLNLDCLKRNYPKTPLLGLTATATVKVKDDIATRLGITNDVLYFQSSYNRPNLFYEIRQKRGLVNTTRDISELLRARFKNQCGIIYCLSTKDCEKLAEKLKRYYGVSCDFYHAQIPAAKRQKIQEDWMCNRINVIIATIAFGMGINKQDVRFIIHFSLPKSIEAYSQECGRAGRDGLKSECILFYNYSDRSFNNFFIANNDQSSKSRKNEVLHGLYSILDYCEETFICRRKLQLNYLGEQFDPKKCQNMCDNCRKGLKVTEKDVTQHANTIIKFISDMQDMDIDISMKQSIDTLLGKPPSWFQQRLGHGGAEKNSGALKKLKEKEIKRMMVRLLCLKVLKETFMKNELPTGSVSVSVYLALGKNAHLYFEQEEKFLISDGIRLVEQGPKYYSSQDIRQNSQKENVNSATYDSNKNNENKEPNKPNEYLTCNWPAPGFNKPNEMMTCNWPAPGFNKKRPLESITNIEAEQNSKKDEDQKQEDQADKKDEDEEKTKVEKTADDKQQNDGQNQTKKLKKKKTNKKGLTFI